MSDNRILTFYPPLNGRLDLFAGLQAWLVRGGQFEFPGANILEQFDSETHVEPVSKMYKSLDSSDANSIKVLIDKFDVKISLNSQWFTLGIQVASYHHASPPIMFWSFDPVLWGKGKGGLDEADTGLLAFARAAGAAYVLASNGLGYELLRHRFVPSGGGYCFVLPPYDPRRSHRILWVDVCEELGGDIPTGHTETGRVARPCGYTRHFLVDTDADFLDNRVLGI